MPNDPLHRLPLEVLAQQMQQRELSPVALVEHYLARIDALNGALGAFTVVTRERALAEARAAEAELRAGQVRSPLHGLPFAVKNSIGVRGYTTAHGTLALHAEAPADAEVVRRLNAAGMVLLGKTRTNDFLSGGTGYNSVEGTALNPWHAEPHMPGGSSSGSAVAVAAGLVAVALGTDNGGSVRIPAALCGLVGLRPGVGRVPRGGVQVLSPDFDAPGPLTRTVQDNAWVLQALAGVDPAEPATRQVAPLPADMGLSRGVRGLRIVPAEQGEWDAAHPAARSAAQRAWSVLAREGAQIWPRPLPEFAEVADLGAGVRVGDVQVLAAYQPAIEAEWEQLNPVAKARIEAARQVSGAQHVTARQDLLALRAALPQRWRDVDALVMVTCLQPAAPAAEALREAKGAVRPRVPLSLNTGFGSQLDLPSLTVPAGFSTDGLPVGVMVCVLPGREPTLYRIGAVLERAFALTALWPDLAWAGDT